MDYQQALADVRCPGMKHFFSFVLSGFPEESFLGVSMHSLVEEGEELPGQSHMMALATPC